MRHEHLVVTVESGLKERIDDDLDSGESLESWVADAIERKLAASETERRDPRQVGGDESTTEDGTSQRERDARFRRRGDDGRTENGGDDEETGDGDGFGRGQDDGFASDGGDDKYDEGFEYVDDCSI